MMLIRGIYYLRGDPLSSAPMIIEIGEWPQRAANRLFKCTTRKVFVFQRMWHRISIVIFCFPFRRACRCACHAQVIKWHNFHVCFLVRRCIVFMSVAPLFHRSAIHPQTGDMVRSHETAAVAEQRKFPMLNYDFASNGPRVNLLAKSTFQIDSTKADNNCNLARASFRHRGQSTYLIMPIGVSLE